jgi:hypothetical protein
MNTTSQFAELRNAFEHPTRGVVGLVDDLLRLCDEQGLHLHWQGDRCHVGSVGGGHDEVFDKPLRKSVFRALVARVAALCNERSPNSVSPYRGQGELSMDTAPPTIFMVRFVNTTDEQKLELIPMRVGLTMQERARKERAHGDGEHRDPDNATSAPGLAGERAGTGS